VAHTCNPSYSRGRDQEDHSLKPVWANSSQDTISKNTITKRAGGVAQGVGPEFKPQYCKNQGGWGKLCHYSPVRTKKTVFGMLGIS
jgi:hypothetical protein